MNVFHDLNFEHYPEDLPLAERWFYRHYFPLYARKACRIATVSEFSKRDIINQYSVPAEKIDVVYNGANESFVPLDEESMQKTRQEYSNGNPYFLFIGALHPRKNLANLFHAYDLFRNESGINIKLMIVGHKKWWTKRIREAYEGMEFKQDVIFSGRLSASSLHRVLGSAMALAYVSYFEGFGIPILEAFYCEVPVITSNITSMPEVAGDAAHLIDPFSVKSIAEGLYKVAADEAYRQRLIERSRARRPVFSWQRSSELLWESIEKALQTK
jgi:glycosyltransferase involved in cell wall biosynthesis